MATRKGNTDRRRGDIDVDALAAEGERGTAGSGRKPGSSSTDAGAATADEAETPEFPSSGGPEPHRGRGTGIKDTPPNGKLPAKR